MIKKRIAVAVSGGIDSLAALLLLVRQGHDVIAVHGRFLAGDDARSPKRLAALNHICQSLGVPLYCPDFSAKFSEEVINPFIMAWEAGRTPNPCMRCNQKIKFDLLLRHALDLGADLFATGHYAALTRNPYDSITPRLLRKTPTRKDQSYFLSFVGRERLEHLVFPLEGMGKEDCRRLARESGFSPPEAEESQDVCFIESGSCRDYLKKKLNGRQEGGPVMLAGRVIGFHDGLANYTIGQRKGLGIPWKAPLYALAKDQARGILHVGLREDAQMRLIELDEINFFTPLSRWPKNAAAQWRHGGKPAPCLIRELEDGIAVILEEAHFITAAGQVCAVYDDGGRLLGAGAIRRVHAREAI